MQGQVHATQVVASVAPAALLNVPGGHCVHEVDAEGLYVPGGQVVQFIKT